MDVMFVVFHRKKGLKRKRRSGLRHSKEGQVFLFCFALLIIKNYIKKLLGDRIDSMDGDSSSFVSTIATLLSQNTFITILSQNTFITILITEHL
jgi:hypothetical protein